MEEPLFHRLEQNFLKGRPLLDRVKLYRGTRLPDQTHGHYSRSAVHGSLLLHVAAAYTHNWDDEGIAFIGSYEIDRSTTRFFQDYGLEKALENDGVHPEIAKSISVYDAELMLEPFVERLAQAKTSMARHQAEEALNAFVRKEMYESNIPTKTPANTYNRPHRLYIYRGKPDVNHDVVASQYLTSVDATNEGFVKRIHLENLRNPVIQDLHRMASKPSAIRNPDLRATANVLKAIAQRDFFKHMTEQHLDKPLSEMMDAIALQPLSDRQVGIGRFARSIFRDSREKARVIAMEIARLDPESSKLSDIKAILDRIGKSARPPSRPS